MFIWRTALVDPELEYNLIHQFIFFLNVQRYLPETGHEEFDGLFRHLPRTVRYLRVQGSLVAIDTGSGAIQQNMIDPGAEWVNHSDGADRSRVGAPTTVSLSDKGLSTIIDKLCGLIP